MVDIVFIVRPLLQPDANTNTDFIEGVGTGRVGVFALTTHGRPCKQMDKPEVFELDDWCSRPINFWRGNSISSLIDGPKHVLSHRLVAGEITACYGEPKSGKTFVAIKCAIAAALDLEFWGEKFSLGGAPIVYFAAERVGQVSQRLTAACRRLGLGAIPKNIILVDGRSQNGVSSEGRQVDIEKFIALINPALIIFDTYARMIDNNEDSAGDATRNIEAFERFVNASSIPCAGILVHHSGKTQSRKMRGSSAMLAAVTTAWKVVGADGTICLSMDDANAFELCEPQYFEIRSVDISEYSTSGPITAGVVEEIQTPSKGRTREGLVLGLWLDSSTLWRDLKDIRVALQDVGEIVGESTLNRTLKELTADGRLETQKSGKRNEYRITEKGLDGLRTT
jgi:hypothetical protein